jgi:hypothetical protein
VKALGATKAKAYGGRPHAECRVRADPVDTGHFAGRPGTNPDDVKFIDDKLKELLAS